MTAPWPMVKLGEVADPVERLETPLPGKRYRQIGVRLWGEGAYERETIDGGATRYRSLNRVEPGDIIVNKIWARNGSVGVVTDGLGGCFGSNEFPTFMPSRKRLEPNWMHWLTKTRYFWEQCDQKSQGTSGKNRIRPEKFLQIPIPLPALAEQRRIVARIEALANRIAEAKRLRQEAEEECRFVTGRVVANWLSELSTHDVFPIEHLAEVRGGIQKGPHRIAGENPIRYLTVAHVHRNRISISDPRYFEVAPSELERWRLYSGDVLIIEGNGSADQIGRTALFRGEIELCVHQNHVIRIRPNQEIIEPEYLNLYLNSPIGQQEVQNRSRTTSGLRSLSVGRIKEITIRVPPLVEQRRIVAELDALQAKVDALRGLQAETAAELDALLPAVLDQAFRGEL